MNLPSADQVKSITRTITVSISSIGATAAAFHLIGAEDPQKLIDAMNAIGNGIASIMVAIGAISTAAMGIWGVIEQSPLRKLFSSTKTIAADPAKVVELQQATIADKAPLALLTDKLPEVATVGTTRSEGGLALAAAVPSNTVNPVQKAA